MPARILIVEDEAITAKHLKLSLIRLGYEVVRMCDTGGEAVKLANELTPDLVLMDIGLAGEMDGIMAAAQIRQTCHKPVVFLTAHADKPTLERAKLSEPFGYLTKPFQESGLQASVEMALYKFQMEELLSQSESRYHAVVDQILDGVLLVELLTNRVLEANLAAQTMLNFRFGAEPGLTAETLLGFSTADLRQLMLNISKSGTFHVGERQYQNRVGVWVDLSLKASLIHYNQGQVLCIVLNDITEIKRAQSELLATNQQLNTQLAQIEELHTELQEVSIRDPLTGLFNRRYLYELIQIEFSRAEREGYPLGFIMVDIDIFKEVNDTFGHSAGDRLLQELGAKLRCFCRLDDLVFRYGGDEFLLVLHRTTAAEARLRMEQLLAEVRQMEISLEGFLINVTISAGIYADLTAQQTIDNMIRQADQALYRAKQAGRNCVQF